MKVRLEDRFTIHGSSYVRPPIQPISIDRGLHDKETFAWHGRQFLCLDTRGSSPGGMSYLLQESGRWPAFSGDVMLDGAKMYTWFDTEWDYGFAAGIAPCGSRLHCWEAARWHIFFLRTGQLLPIRRNS